MSSCGTNEVLISKGEKLSKLQCPKNDLERKTMENKPYASLVGSLMYGQVSKSGYVFLKAYGAVSWKNEKQDTVAASTMVAEYLSCCETINQAVWLKNFLMGLKVVDSIARPIQIYCDNNAAIFFSKNNKRSAATMNLDIKYLITREKVVAGLVKIDYLETGSMLQIL